MMMNLMTILMKKVFISSKPTFVRLLCPPPCGPFSIQESTVGGLSYKGTKAPVNPVVYNYYTHKCVGKKKCVAVGAVMHKICNIIFAMLRDNKPFEIISPEEHCKRYAVEHPEAAHRAA